MSDVTTNTRSKAQAKKRITGKILPASMSQQGAEGNGSSKLCQHSLCC
jgi:hypothetical protein